MSYNDFNSSNFKTTIGIKNNIQQNLRFDQEEIWSKNLFMIPTYSIFKNKNNDYKIIQ